ncbi:MAG: V-type ATP synthase subunit E [Ruminococcus sp.]|nr:V-type ATP synthase subunit E [Ruminococcus sp.]
MTGLDKILAQIKADTDFTCADIKKKAEAQCTDILNSAHAEADKIRKNSETEAKDREAEILKRAESAAQLQRRSVMLSAKQEIISSSIDSALNYFCNLPQEEYFEMLYSMVAKYSEPSEGEILVSAKDFSRLPKDFNDIVSKSAKGTLSVSEETADIKGGFILKYGGIEVNCALESIFLAENERFSDTVSRILFEKRRSL